MRTPLRFAATLCALSLAACRATPAGDALLPTPEEEIPSDVGDTPSPDAGVEGTPTAPGPEVTASERLGVYSESPTAAVLPGVKSSVVLFGTLGTTVDPRWFGREPKAGSFEGWVRAGLIVLDSDTGKARLLTHADGLPLTHYKDGFSDYGLDTARILDLAWITPDTTFAAATWETLTIGTSDGKGGYGFRSIRLRAPNQTADMNVARVALAGGELFAAGDQGVVALDPNTLAVKRWYHLGANAVVPPAWTFGLSVGELKGAPVVAVLTAPNGSLRATKVALLHPGSSVPELFDFAQDGASPLSLLGMKGSVLVGVKETDDRGAIRAIVDTPSGLKLSPLVSANDLAASSDGAVIPGRLAFDPKQELLLVGGSIFGAVPAVSSGFGRGFVKLACTADGKVSGKAQDILPPGDDLRAALPGRLDTLAVDAKGRWYFSGRGQCSEVTLRVMDVLRAEFTPSGELRLVRPWLSGVRSFAVEPTKGNLLVALHDENPGVACSGVNAQEQICTLKADGSCELFAPRVTEGLFRSTPGVSSIAFGRPDRREMALATYRDGFFARVKDHALALQTQLDPKINKTATVVRYGEGGLWIGSLMEWSPDETDPTLDTEKINDRGPHGLGYLELDDMGRVTTSRRYVRAVSDFMIDEVGGLPSNSALDVLALPGNRTALVACGIERNDNGTYDHWPAAPNKRNHLGGLGLVEDRTVTALSPPAGKAFSDVVALAKAADGTVYALDAELGLLTVDVAKRTSAVWKSPDWVAPVRPLSLAVDGASHLAVGTTKGVLLYGADKVVRAFAPDAGFVWTVRFTADGVLLAGTDQGLLRVALDGKALPTPVGPANAVDRELWPLPAKCDGSAGCACVGPGDCQKGFDCLCAAKGGACSCAVADPCAASPSPSGCSCLSAPDCGSGLTCNCDASGGCLCGYDPASCDGAANCPCKQASDCPLGFFCNASGQCAARQACDSDCSCATASKCSPGLHCQGGIAGSSCVP